MNIRTEKVEDRLPLVAANITLRGLDAGDGDLVCNMQPAEMIWGTGAHHTTIAEEMLLDRFREYLQDPINEPYWSPDGVRLQLEATITFSNSVVPINAVAVIVPRARIPNQHAGILFGQTLCIDQLVYRSVPRSILLARGEQIEENIWGDIIVEEYLDMNEGEIKVL